MKIKTLFTTFQESLPVSTFIDRCLLISHLVYSLKKQKDSITFGVISKPKKTLYIKLPFIPVAFMLFILNVEA